MWLCKLTAGVPACARCGYCDRCSGRKLLKGGIE